MAAFDAGLNYGSSFALEETDSETEADEGGESGAIAGLPKKMRRDGLKDATSAMKVYRDITVRNRDQNSVYLWRERGGRVAGEQGDGALDAARDVAAEHGLAALKVPGGRQ